MAPAALLIVVIIFVFIVIDYISPLQTVPGFDGCYCKHCGFDVREQVRTGDEICPECAKPLPPKGHLTVERLESSARSHNE
jgi:hypothetical protein